MTWSEGSGPTRSTTTGPSTSIASTTSSTTSPSSSTSLSDPGLSDGAKAGIGVGVALGVLSLARIIIAIFFGRRKRTRRVQPDNTSQELDDDNFAKSQTGYAEMPSETAPQEIHGWPIAASRQWIHETAGSHVGANDAKELEAPRWKYYLRFINYDIGILHTLHRQLHLPKCIPPVGGTSTRNLNVIYRPRAIRKPKLYTLYIYPWTP